MRILVISHAAGTPQIGPNMRTFYLARKLVAAGYKVNIVGSGVFHKYRSSPLPNIGEDAEKVVDGINYRWLATRPYEKRGVPQVLNQLSFAYKLWSIRKKLVQLNPSFVIMSSPPPLGIYAASYIAHKSGAKLIFEIRDLWPEIIEELGGFGPNHPYIKMVKHSVKFAYKRAKGIVSVKPGDLSFIENKYKSKAHLEYIPNGFDHTGVLDKPYEHPILKEKGFKLVYTGALSNYYAIGSLLGAAKFLKTTHSNLIVLIAGDGEDREQYEAYKNEHKLDNVYFLGFLPKENMLSLIRQCDAAFLGLKDTKANQLGISTNKLYEYMYAKSPVIASYNTDHDIVKESGAGLTVEPESAEAIADAIEKICAMSAEERRVMGEKGYSYLMQHHTFDTITEKYLNLFELLDK